MLSLDNISISGKKVLIRSDLNVPLRDGKLLDDNRIVASLPSIKHCLKEASQVIIMSHFGRPDPAKPAAEQSKFSLEQLVPILQPYLTSYLGDAKLAFAPTIQAAKAMDAKCILLENTRFFAGETDNDPALSQQLASLCDVFIMDAFGSAHREHASTAGVVTNVEVAGAGILLEKEVDALTKLIDKPARPLLAIVGGAKVGDKLRLLEKLADLADILIVGGGIANTFLAAKGHQVGKSLYEPDLRDLATDIMDKVTTLLPVDVVVGSGEKGLDDEAPSIVTVDQVAADGMILDVGAASLASYAKALGEAQTILWNGPLGVFEKPAFAKGTQGLTKIISAADAYSVAGGGETIAAINRFSGKVSYASTGGGAFLEYVEQGGLPALELLNKYTA